MSSALSGSHYIPSMYVAQCSSLVNNCTMKEYFPETLLHDIYKNFLGFYGIILVIGFIFAYELS